MDTIKVTLLQLLNGQLEHVDHANLKSSFPGKILKQPFDVIVDLLLRHAGIIERVERHIITEAATVQKFLGRDPISNTIEPSL